VVVKETFDPRTRVEESLRYLRIVPLKSCIILWVRYLVPDDPNMPYEMLSVVKKIVDENTVFEIMPEFAKNIICGFARMEGKTVGVKYNDLFLLKSTFK
jgi:hypothetical protein